MIPTMNRTFARLALAGVVLLFLWPVGASAQTSTQDGQRTYTQQGLLIQGLVRADSTGKALTMTSDGELKVYLTNANTESYHVWQDIIQADSTAGPDSSDGGANGLGSIIDTHGYRHLTLLMKVWTINHRAANFKNDLRLAVQVRTHINGLDDSLSTFANYPFGVGAAGVGTGAVAKGDTLTTGHISTGSANLPWSGEFVVNVANNRSAPTGGGPVAFSYPNGIAIPLNSLFGRDFWAPGISVRVRILDTDSWKWGGSVHLMGTAL